MRVTTARRLETVTAIRMVMPTAIQMETVAVPAIAEVRTETPMVTLTGIAVAVPGEIATVTQMAIPTETVTAILMGMAITKSC